MNVHEAARHSRTQILVGLGIGALVVLGSLIAVNVLTTRDPSRNSARSNVDGLPVQESTPHSDLEARQSDQVLQLHAALRECQDSSRAALEENARLRKEIDELRVKRVTLEDSQSGSISEGDTIGGLRMGKWTERHPNGQEKATGNYLYGKEIGEWRYWNEDGSMKMRGLWSEGQKVGAWTIFDHEANSVTEVTYVNGVPTEAITK